jgi:hypothetical protein
MPIPIIFRSRESEETASKPMWEYWHDPALRDPADVAAMLDEAEAEFQQRAIKKPAEAGF